MWVSNTQLGTLLRIPIRPDGSAGPIQTIATGLAGIDDFAFTGPGPSAPVLAAINRFSTVVLIRARQRTASPRSPRTCCWRP